ncbi:MAG: polyribonucleotide nucleotidyltransferase [Planctomycetaceae bacterium]|nr:polyribonucleotide nucleotidyltransferase [Planctomycetaceae bacterium]
MTKIRVERQIGSRVLWVETGELAKQAAGSCLIGYGNTVVLCAVTTGAARPGTDFFPLTCDYRERVAAVGKFPGGFVKREGKPTLKEVLTSRLLDRPMRPLFPPQFYNEVQVNALVLASDKTIDPDTIAMNGSSFAAQISPLPFRGPLASVRLAYIDGQFVVFPDFEQLEYSNLDLIVSGNMDSILMLEGFAREMPEGKMYQAIIKAHEYIKQICELQLELLEKAQPKKIEFVPISHEHIFNLLKEKHYDEFWQAKRTEGKLARYEACAAVKDRARAELFPESETTPALLGPVDTPVDLEESEENTASENGESSVILDAGLFEVAWHEFEERVVRDQILAGTRADGRNAKDVRDIECRVGILPCVHGSALFQRGETQALVTVTLGTARDEQKVDGIFDEYSKKFMLDYNFPSYSVGECRPNRGPGRREYGHGALAERSVKPVLPDPEDFPYTIRVISDILESNGSSSMATVCGSTLGLMAAGVPISNPVAGISVGLVKESDDQWILLTDIMGDEDHYGDMDFKIAGTQNGITGIQLDLKIDGISPEIIMATIKQSREARIHILRKMLAAIPRPADDISATAPRLFKTQIDPEKIGLLIGPGGKTIRGIQDATGASIDIENDGTVFISASSEESASRALTEVNRLTASVEIGKIYEGQVISVKTYGAFIEILPGRDGLCHISDIADDYIENINAICKVGDRMLVKVMAVDEQNRIKLSRREALRELQSK